MTRFILAYLLGVLALNQSAFGQDEAQLWLESGLRIKAHKNLSLEWTENIRLRNNLSSFDSIKSDLDAEWKAHKSLRLGMGYRLSFEANKNGVLEGSHRVHLQAVAKHKVGRLRVAYRLRFQEGIKREDQETRFRHVMRNRLKVQYDTNALAEPDLAVEVFNRFADKQAVQLQKIRTTAGVSLRLNKAHKMRAYYRLEVPLFKPTDPRHHIIGLGYQYRLKVK